MDWNCPICKEDKIPVVLVPCGHSYCYECSRHSQECGFCRKKIKTTVVSTVICNMLGVDIPVFDPEKDLQKLLENKYKDIKEEGEKKVEEIVLDLLSDVQYILSHGYYEKTFSGNLSYFEEEIVKTRLTELFKKYNISVRIVVKESEFRVELTVSHNKPSDLLSMLGGIMQQQ